MATEMQHYNQNDPATVLSLSQRAPSMLSKSSLKPKSKLLSVVSAIEEPLEWAELEQIFLACLRSSDDETAHLCLERLTTRFGAENHRVMALRGLYQEAEAKNEEDLRRILQGYNKIVDADPMNFLATFPSDAEAWCELSDLYQTQGMSSQAIFCLEEALLIVPNAWNLHARLGELNYLASQSGQEGAPANEKHLTEAVRRFARSVELCQDYLRGLYGLKIATDKLSTSQPARTAEAISSDVVQQLNNMAATKLKHIIKQDSAHAVGPKKAEIIAAQALLDQSKS
ncbi:Inositol phosphatase SIW14 [Lithohypha guttulata]|uniref:ER membrane protein complex subunit 2 n=1 Tax=Lithohypha guttulata TaxID=1690604 RepID=A0AAN7YKP6_9EURO|nr:Inositol phosphatase SIW14 [Lithohypha guttulata]